MALVRKIHTIFEVFTVIETASHIRVNFYANEGPYANFINEITNSVNKVLGPYVEEKLMSIGVVDYKVKFSITKTWLVTSK